MQTIALLLPIVLATGLFAQATATAQEWEKYTALGIVAVVLIFLVTKMLPSAMSEIMKQGTEFQKAILANQIAFKESLDKILERHENDQKVIVAELSRVREQCLATRLKWEDESK
jgi:Sec-independent protein translocase protein TatA